MFTFLVPDSGKGKEPPCELIETHLWVDRFAKEASYFDVFLRVIYTETSGSTLEKNCYLI